MNITFQSIISIQFSSLLSQVTKRPIKLSNLTTEIKLTRTLVVIGYKHYQLRRPRLKVSKPYVGNFYCWYCVLLSFYYNLVYKVTKALLYLLFLTIAMVPTWLFTRISSLLKIFGFCSRPKFQSLFCKAVWGCSGHHIKVQCYSLDSFPNPSFKKKKN